jgi:hypothetical protein
LPEYQTSGGLKRRSEMGRKRKSVSHKSRFFLDVSPEF